MSLYKITNDELWKKRAEAFILTITNDEMNKVIENYKYSGFKL